MNKSRIFPATVTNLIAIDAFGRKYLMWRSHHRDVFWNLDGKRQTELKQYHENVSRA